MSQTSSEISNELVVPEKVLPVFQGAVVLREVPSVLDKPKTFSGKINRMAKKSTLVTGLTSVFGSIALDGYIDSTVQFADPFSHVAITVGIVAVVLGGMVATAVGLDSTILGSGKYTPLPPTKKYLELEKANTKSHIAPFDSWDSLFEKTTSK